MLRAGGGAPGARAGASNTAVGGRARVFTCETVGTSEERRRTRVNGDQEDSGLRAGERARRRQRRGARPRSEEHTSELQSQSNLVCRLLLEKKKKDTRPHVHRRNRADSADLLDQAADSDVLDDEPDAGRTARRDVTGRR